MAVVGGTEVKVDVPEGFDIEHHEHPPPDAEMVLFGPDAQSPVRDAQRLRASGFHGPFLFLAPAADVPGLQATLQVTPMIGGDAQVMATGQDVGPMVEQLARDAQRRKRSRAMASFAQASLGQEAPSQTEQVLLDRLLESAPVGIAVVSADGHIVGWNRHAQACTGRSERSVLGRPLEDGLGVADAALDAQDGLLEVEARNGDGEDLVLSVTTAQVPVGEGTGQLVAFHDVTARAHAERALQAAKDHLEERVAERTRELAASESRYRRLVETSHDLIWSIDAAGVFSFVNEGPAHRIYGRDASDIIGMHFLDFSADENMDADRDALDRLLAGHEIQGHETVQARADGTEVVTSWNAAPIEENGHVVGATGTASDITERRRAQEEREKARRRLQEVQELRAHEAFRTSFVNAAAHELRTPLTPLLVQLRILNAVDQDHLTDRQKRALSIVERSAQRFHRLVEDLLDASRYQGGRLGLDLKRGDIGELAHRVVEEYAPVAMEGGLELSLDADPDVPVEMDSDRMLQVLQNLVNNAIKFTEAGAVHVVAKRDGDEAVVKVQDDGPGLEPAQIDRLFQPFTQVHEDQELRRKGAGLGLYLCRALTELHQGSITCESEGRGKGATFTVRLPLAEPEVRSKDATGRP